MSSSPFDPAALDKIIRETLPKDVQPGEKVIVGTVDQRGVKVAAHFAFDGGWQLEAAVAHDWKGDTAAGAKVIRRW